MPTTPEGFAARLARLKADLVEQGRRVRTLLETGFEAHFAGDARAADAVIKGDEVIDAVDVDLERAAVQLLSDATGSSATLAPEQLRLVLTIVKVNNELERIADAAVAVAERVSKTAPVSSAFPPTFRVLTNSIVGIVGDANAALDRMDGRLARRVLASEDARSAFKQALLRDVAAGLADRSITIDLAFAMQEIAAQCDRIADYATNIAEQVLYASSGTIVRHMHGHWEDVAPPSA